MLPSFCFRTQIDALEARLTQEHANWLGFCHNDLQCGNVMLDAGSLDKLRSFVALDAACFAVVRISNTDAVL